MALKFRYFPLWAKGPAIALALEHNDFEWEGDNQGEWPVLKQETPWRELPILEIPGYGMMGHELAILNYLGAQKDVASGSTQAEKLASAEIMQQAEDIYLKLIKSQDTISQKGKSTREENANLWEGTDRTPHNRKFGFPVMLGLLEEFYQTRKVADGRFTTSGSSVGECKLFASLRSLVMIKADILTAFSGLKTFYSNFEAHEKTQAIITTGGKMPRAFQQYFVENTYEGSSLTTPKVNTMTMTMYYFPAAGRAETIRLIAACGGIAIEEPGRGETLDKAEFGSPGSLPLLQHGDLKIAQSGAIETYLSTWAFPDLTPKQRAVDFQLCCMKEDVFGGFVKVFFTPDLKAKAGDEIKKITDKWFPVVESIVPVAGFFNGMPYPTAADLAILNFCEVVMPFGIGYRDAKIDMSVAYPKMVALAARVADVPCIRAYIASSTTFKSNPFNL